MDQTELCYLPATELAALVRRRGWAARRGSGLDQGFAGHQRNPDDARFAAVCR